MNGSELLRLVDTIHRDKNIDKEIVFEGIEQHLMGATLTERRKEFLDALRKGDSVYFTRYGRRCQIHKIDREGAEAVVKLGSMKMRVSLDEITWLESL